jgi:hypothetical protein
MNRNHVIATVVLVTCMIAAAAFQVHGQGRKPATRIRFKRGQSSTTIKGQLTSRRVEKVFLVGAQSGQELYLQIKARTSDGLDFALLSVYEPSGNSLGITQDDLRVRLKQTGDVRLEISPPGSFYRENLKGYKELQFTLFVRIQ